MYIGEIKIKKVNNGSTAESVILEMAESVMTMDRRLFEAIKTKEKGKGDITDAIRHFFVSKFLAELASYDMKYYVVDQVAAGLQALAHNLREEAFGKKFGCVGAFDIPLINLLVENEQEKKEEK